MRMRKGLFLLLTIVLLFGLVSCAALLEDYQLIYRPHEVNPAFEPDDVDQIVVSTRDDLTRSIRNMVNNQDESRQFRVLHIGLETVEDAILEVLLQPLVAYAVSDIRTITLSEQVGLLELELVVSYRKTAEQIADVQRVHTAAGAEAILGRMLHEGRTYLALLCPVNIANLNFLETSIRNFYDRHPLDTLILPELTVSFYPSAGDGNLRIAAIELEFGIDHDSFTQMSTNLRETAEEMVSAMPEDLSVGQQVIWLSRLLSAHTVQVYDEDERSTSATAYGALVAQSASSEGLARGLQALLSLFDIDAFIIHGELDEAPHVWNLIYIDGYYYHIDISMLPVLGAGDALFVPDEVMIFGNGYGWDLNEHPRAESALRYADFVQ